MSSYSLRGPTTVDRGTLLEQVTNGEVGSILRLLPSLLADADAQVLCRVGDDSLNRYLRL